MKRILQVLSTVIPVLFLCINTSASPAPTKEAAIKSHLVSVNNLWAEQIKNETQFSGLSHFNNENSRIQFHLFQVIKKLEAIEHPDFSRNQKVNRNALLNKLKHYALAADFPVNTNHNIRIPYFIDYKNTACAVGYLLIESGNEDLALKISRDMNNAYILDMPYKEIDLWAFENGFKKDELALIQPGYPPTNSWSSMGEGISGEVHVMLAGNDANSVIIAGEFSDASGVACNNVVLWDGSNYTAMGNNLDGTINTGIQFNNTIYFGGDFTTEKDLAYWNGISWLFLNLFEGENSAVTDLYNLNGTLYASGFTGNSNQIAKFTDEGWEIIPGDFNGRINAICQLNNELVIGGEFTALNFDLEVPLTYVAKWNGNTWEPIEGGVSGPVNAMESYLEGFFAGGKIGNTDMEVCGLSYYTNSEGWLSIYSDPYALPQHEIKDILISNGTPIISGLFDINPVIGIHGNNLAEVNVIQESTLPTALIRTYDSDNSGAVNTVIEMGNDLYCAGSFSEVYGGPDHLTVNNVARTEYTVGLDETHFLEVKIYPNPSRDRIYIDLEGKSIAILKVYDIRGKLLLNYKNPSKDNSYDLGSLNSGVYVCEIQLENEKNLLREKIIIQ